MTATRTSTGTTNQTRSKTRRRSSLQDHPQHHLSSTERTRSVSPRPPRDGPACRVRQKHYRNIRCGSASTTQINVIYGVKVEGLDLFSGETVLASDKRISPSIVWHREKNRGIFWVPHPPDKWVENPQNRKKT